jgi:hypothetical protein
MNILRNELFRAIFLDYDNKVTLSKASAQSVKKPIAATDHDEEGNEVQFIFARPGKFIFYAIV